MKVIKPPHLPKNGTIGIIAPASPVNPDRLKKGIAHLQHRGYRVELGKHVYEKNNFIAGSDAQRLEDLHAMFTREDIDAIICARGGYGTPRLLDQIDYALIRKNPKIFVGYSDLTSFQLALYKKTKMISFSGLMAAVEFAEKVPHPITEENYWRLLQHPEPFGEMQPIEKGRSYKILKHGKAEGRLLGGCLALINGIAGTPYFPNFKDHILILEDVGETPMRIDRYFSQLKLAGVFDACAGIIIGRFEDSEDSEREEQGWIRSVIDYHLKDVAGPVINFFEYGHFPIKHTLAIGANIAIDTANNSIKVTEAAVR